MSRHHLIWRFHVESLMRSCGIVHADGILYGGACRDEVQLAVVEEPGVLHRVVHPLGQCIVQRVARLRHADLHIYGQKHLHILLRGVLHAAVRVVNQLRYVNAEVGIAFDSHLQGLQRTVRLKRLMEAPAHDVAAVGIRQQRQVAEALAAIDVGNVGYHQYPCAFCHQLWRGVQQVWPDAVIVVGIRRSGPVAFPAQHQSVGTQHVVETVAAKSELHTEVLFAEVQKFAATRFWQVVRRTDIVAVEHYARDEDGLLILLLVMLVVAPS